MRETLIGHRGNKSQEQVAQDLGITRQMLGMIERGERNPSFFLMKRIADYYGLKVDDLFFNQIRNKTCL